MLHDAITFLLAHPGLLVLIVFGAAAVEYVFPPFWGDTLMLAGSFVAGLDRAMIPAVFAGALAGSCVGAMGAWWMGRKFGRATLSVLQRSRRLQAVAFRAERLHAAHGARMLAFNRFLPGIRAFLMPLAGIGNMSGRRAFVWSTVSNVLYCAVIVTIGAVVASRTTDLGLLQASFQRVTIWAAALAFATLVVLTTRSVLRARSLARASA